MPLRPFPFPFSIGTDIIHVKRITSILGKAWENPKYLDRFLRRFLTPREHREYLARFGAVNDANLHHLDAASRHLAGRWAAKEATIKATTWRRLSFHDILVLRSRNRGGLVAVILDTAAAKNNKSRQATSDRIDRHIDFSMSRPYEQAHGQVDHSEGTLSSKLSEPEHSSANHKVQNELPQQMNVAAEDESLFAEDLSSDLSGQVAKISISHDGDYATAVCLAAVQPMEGDVGGEAAARELL